MRSREDEGLSVLHQCKKRARICPVIIVVMAVLGGNSVIVCGLQSEK